MKIMKLLLSVLLALNVVFASSQTEEQYSIRGKVFDAHSKAPMEYCTVTILNTDSAIVNGTITREDGAFLLKTAQPGDYIIKIGFIGYRIFTKRLVIISGDRVNDIGEIELNAVSSELGEVIIEAEKSYVEYKIDKKIVHIGNNLSAISGSVAEALINTPSVQVDNEGNVSLRGKSNFTVLIDGRPSTLEASEALQQIPASTVQSVEIITNPSVKYDPEGTAGIINIITKKRSLEGFSGIINANAGLDEKYGGDFLLNYRTQKFNYFLGAEYNKRNNPGTIKSELITFSKDTNFINQSDGEYNRVSYRANIKGGIEWFLNKKTVFALTGNYGYRESSNESEKVFTSWHEINNKQINTNSYFSNDSRSREGSYYAINTDFSREFSSKEHKLDAQISIQSGTVTNRF